MATTLLLVIPVEVVGRKNNNFHRSETLPPLHIHASKRNNYRITFNGIIIISSVNQRKFSYKGVSMMSKKKAKIEVGKTPISVLHEKLAKAGCSLPKYELVYDWTLKTTNVSKFTWKVIAAGKEAYGTDNNKKKAKQDAARNMLMQICDDVELLKALPQNAGDNIQNHIGNLSMFCSRNALPQPNYYEDDEDGPAHSRRFYWNCIVGQHREVGCAHTTKLAKQLAAQAMYLKLIAVVHEPNDSHLPDYRLNTEFMPLCKIEKTEKILAGESEDMDVCENEHAESVSLRSFHHTHQQMENHENVDRNSNFNNLSPSDSASASASASVSSSNSTNFTITSEEYHEKKYKGQLSSFTDWMVPITSKTYDDDLITKENNRTNISQHQESHGVVREIKYSQVINGNIDSSEDQISVEVERLEAEEIDVTEHNIKPDIHFKIKLESLISSMSTRELDIAMPREQQNNHSNELVVQELSNNSGMVHCSAIESKKNDETLQNARNNLNPSIETTDTPDVKFKMDMDITADESMRDEYFNHAQDKKKMVSMAATVSNVTSHCHTKVNDNLQKCHDFETTISGSNKHVINMTMYGTQMTSNVNVWKLNPMQTSSTANLTQDSKNGNSVTGGDSDNEKNSNILTLIQGNGERMKMVEVKKPVEIKISDYYYMMLIGHGVDLKPKVCNRIRHLVEALTKCDFIEYPHIVDQGIEILKEIVVLIDLHLDRVVYIADDGDYIVVIRINSISEIVEMTKNCDFHQANRSVFFKVIGKLDKMLM
uniref:Prkra_1 protein n=1 Tax=Fopius arisanus TaxID=64838 RepID=A0A0C9QG79_9HYME